MKMNNDLISRSELKKVIETYRPIPIKTEYSQGKNNMIDYCIAEIDNAPTVELTELCKGCQYLKDCETCDKNERPQGEWELIRVADHCGIHDSFVCPFCNYEREYRKKNLCEECGADMRGEKNG